MTVPCLLYNIKNYTNIWLLGSFPGGYSLDLHEGSFPGDYSDSVNPVLCKESRRPFGQTCLSEQPQCNKTTYILYYLHIYEQNKYIILTFATTALSK